MFIVHPTKGRGWATGISASRNREIVILQGGRRLRLTPELLYSDPTPPAYPPDYQEHLTITTVVGHIAIFDVYLAWRMIHPTRERCVFASLDEMRSLVEIGKITPSRLKNANFDIPALVGDYYGTRYIIDGYHRVTRALEAGVTMQYYLLSPAETNYIAHNEYDYTIVKGLEEDASECS